MASEVRSQAGVDNVNQCTAAVRARSCNLEQERQSEMAVCDIPLTKMKQQRSA